MTVRVEANIVFRAYQNHDGVWTAVCDPLGLTVEGDSWTDVWKSADESLNILLRDLLKRNELSSFLRARGWSMARPHHVKRTSRVRFDVPFRVTPVAADESGQRVYS
jgi:hypothetical protein